MSCNIMETYINFTQKNILSYLRIILQDKYDKKIASELTNTYIDARYYNYTIDDSTKILSKKIFKCLCKKEERLKEKFPKKQNIIVQTFYLFKYIFYIDGVKNDKAFSELIEEIYVRRIKKLGISKQSSENFKESFYKRVEEDNLRRTKFLKNFETDSFELVKHKYSLLKNTYNISLKSNVKFKDIYKEEAIENVFNTGLIAEDKLIIEYSLIAIYIANEVIKGRFNKKYFINYTPTLLKKKRKNNQILNIINNQAIQHNLVLKIPFMDFVKSRFDVYDLMKKGYRFAIIIEKDNCIDNVNLNMFKFILISKDHPKLEKYMNQYNNVIVI